MTLIKSISGIRGTIGGKIGTGLTPIDIVQFTAAYANWIIAQGTDNNNNKIIVGRDARISGEMVQGIVMHTLTAMGIEVLDAGLTTTPTLAMAVIIEKAAGGIMITASHNSKEWNALKLLNNKGEFLNQAEANHITQLVDEESFDFSSIEKIGLITPYTKALQSHIDAIVHHPLVNVTAIRQAKFNIVVDTINSTGALAIPMLFKALGIKNFKLINGEMNGKFAHNPEPLPQHLSGLANEVTNQKANLGIAVDPDVDRLCFVCEDGSFFGEEYTLVAIADYVLKNKLGNTVSNLSSTRALKELTLQYPTAAYFSSAVGEINVVEKMKAVNAVIGGEGNGGIIVPDLHYGRDALIGIALFLTFLAKENKSIKQLRSSYPDYFIAKTKIQLEPKQPFEKIIQFLQQKYKTQEVDITDGIKIDFEDGWVHLRMSNTEPILRIYSESNFETTANNMIKQILLDIKNAV